MQEEGVYLVNLFNPATKTSQWIPVNGKAPGLEVKSYDAAADKEEDTQGGRALTLSLKQARVALAQAAPRAAPTPENGEGNRPGRPEGSRSRFGPPIPSGNGGEPPMVRNLPPEAQAMIQEFRRRRAERANQQQQSSQNQPQNSPRVPGRQQR